MKVLVTGGCGFIGSHITDQLIESKHEVVVIDNLSAGNTDNLNPQAKLYRMDIRSRDIFDVISGFAPEAVFHEAAQIDVQKSIKDPSFDADVNILGTVNLLSACAAAGVKRFIYASSAAIYGNPEYLGIDEKHPVNPISCYGISKYAPEHYIKAFAELNGFLYTIFRYANVYGIRQSPKGEGGVISIFTDKLNKGEVINIFGSGEQTRDFIYVKDIAKANVLSLELPASGILNLGTGVASTINTLYKTMAAIRSSGAKPDYQPERPGDIVHSYFDIRKLKAVLGFAPEYSLYEGLEETLEYYS